MSSSDILRYWDWTLLADRTRMSAYQRAIHATVRAGDVVADLGTGSGVMAFFALQAGARKVYAIESDPIISVAQQLAEKNAMADRIVFIKGHSEQVDLPEQVDVIISEIIGMFGLEEDALHYVLDFRDRCLKPGGALVPAWLDLYLVPVESPQLWDATVGLWGKDFYGLDFSSVRTEGFSERYLMDCAGKIRRMTAETPIAHLDFSAMSETSPPFTLRLSLEGEGTIHGYVGYFKGGLSPQVILSTSPDDPPTHWQQSFFPLPEPVAVQAGDVLECRLTAFKVGPIFWKWDTRIIPQASPPRQFSQSNFRLSKDELLLSSRDYAPTLTLKGEIRKLALEACNGRRTMADIARMLQEAYPEHFKDIKAAYTVISSIVSGKLLA